MLFCFLTLVGAPGNLERQSLWWTWEGHCHQCSKRIQPWEGIFCQNFASSRGAWMPCRFASCAEHYVDEGQPGFPVCSAFNDESIYYNRRREDVMKYRMGRRGDSLIAPFQCEGCWFVNLHGRAPVVGNYSDTQKQRVIRRANLDLFWSREAGTVRNIYSQNVPSLG